jgi:RNA polymerase sigma-70 factor (sigma-E family)
MRALDDDAEREFRAFVRAQTPALTRAAYLLTGDRHQAQDLVQSALANTALRWSAAVQNPGAYTRKALYHQAVSRWRWLRRRPESLPGILPEPTPRPNDDVELRIVVQVALAKLTPRQRAVLVLRYFEDLSEADAAAVLGCAVGTVKSQTRHALSRLRVLAPELEDLWTPVEVDQ